METCHYNDRFVKAELNAHGWIQSLEAEILELKFGPTVQTPIMVQPPSPMKVNADTAHTVSINGNPSH
jgi:hypothetical protein